jgi:hypothetical protein
MINKELESLLGDDDGTDVEVVKLDIDLVKSNVPQYTSEKLCEMIVCDRYFGFEHKISIICMEELAKRRTNGDTFHFESHIEQIQKEMPVLNLVNPDLRSMLHQVINGKVKK